MNIVTEEKVVLCDVDNTLIEDYIIPKIYTPYDCEPVAIAKASPSDYITLNYYGKEVHKKPINTHVDFVRSLKQRGYYVIVHSGNGYLWAKQVVTALGMADCVDMVMTKACKHIDDDPDPTHIIGPRVYLK